jgi:hypothetical protein
MLPSRPGAGSDPAGEDEPAHADAAVHALGSGTGLRFVLLVALVAASTVSMMSDHIVLRRLLGDPNNDSAGCNIAAGRDPGGTFWGNGTALAGRNAEALKACAEPFQIAWWAPIVVVGTVFALAAVLCWATPLWKIRRRGLRPVDPVPLEKSSLQVRLGIGIRLLTHRGCVCAALPAHVHPPDAQQRGADPAGHRRPVRRPERYVSQPTDGPGRRCGALTWDAQYPAYRCAKCGAADTRWPGPALRGGGA